MNKTIITFIGIFVSILWSFESFGQQNNESPYAFLGDGSMVLDIKHTHKDTQWKIKVIMPDLTFASIEMVDDTLRVIDSAGKYINIEKVNPIFYAMFTTIDPKAEEMPWMSPYSYCFNDPINLIDKNGERPSCYEAALMAKIVYVKDLSNDDLPEELRTAGWGISQFNTSIKMNNTYWYENGLQSALFEKTVDGVTEYAYVFAGTNSIEDFFEDIFQIFGIAPQYDSAIMNANFLSEELNGRELTFVGHSLGGGEAAAASMATGRPAVTFNPAAVSPMTKCFYSLGSAENVTNYRIIPSGNGKIRIGGCFVNNLQDNCRMSAPGTTINIELPLKNPFAAHSIDNFVKYFCQ